MYMILHISKFDCKVMKWDYKTSPRGLRDAIDVKTLRNLEILRLWDKTMRQWETMKDNVVIGTMRDFERCY